MHRSSRLLTYARTGGFSLLALAATLTLARALVSAGPAPATAVAEPAPARVPAVASQHAITRERESAAPQAGLLGVVLAHASIDLAPRTPGRLRAVHVRLGDAVAKGDRIADVDAPDVRSDLAAAEAALTTARVERDRAAVELTDAEQRLARTEQRAAEGLASGEERLTAQYQVKIAASKAASARAQVGERQSRVDSLREARADTEIRAPFTGVVAARYADPGAGVTAATPIVRLIGGGDLFVRFAVPEDQRARAIEGRAVRVAAGGETLRGVVDKIAPEVDAASRMITVEARLDVSEAASRRLISGGMARVSFVAEEP